MRAAWCEAELVTTAASSLPRQTEPTAPGGLGWAAPPGHCLGAAPHTATLLPLLRNSSTLHDSQIHIHVSKTSSFEHPNITHQKLHCPRWCWCTLLTVGKWRGGTLGQLAEQRSGRCAAPPRPPPNPTLPAAGDTQRNSVLQSPVFLVTNYVTLAAGQYADHTPAV